MYIHTDIHTRNIIYRTHENLSNIILSDFLKELATVCMFTSHPSVTVSMERDSAIGFRGQLMKSSPRRTHCKLWVCFFDCEDAGNRVTILHFQLILYHGILSILKRIRFLGIRTNFNV